jgi:competence protein ComEC
VRPAAWPWGFGIGVALGIAAANWLGAAWGLGTFATLLPLPFARRWPVGWRALLVATLLGLVLGVARGALAEQTPEPWAGRAGERLQLRVRVSDGVAWPDVAGVAGLLLRGRVPADGVWQLEGRLLALAGKRNPGGFDARAHYARHGIGAALFVESSERVAPPGLRLRARAALHAGVVEGLSPPVAALMQAITLGIRDDLGDLRAAFAGSGLAHVLALSGLHVGLLAALLSALVGGVGRVRSPIVVGTLLAYVALVGPSPAVVRATAMIAIALLSRAFGVGGAGWGSHLMIAGSLSLLYRPSWLTDLGFQLSYLSVLGMGWGATPIAEWLRALGRRWGGPRLARPGRFRERIGQGLRSSLAVSLSAQWATTSLVASNFGAFPWVAPLANLIALPLAGLLVPLGFAAALLGVLHPQLAALVNLATEVVAGGLLAVARGAARAPGLPWGEVSALGHVTFAIASCALLAALHRHWRPWRAALVIALAATVSYAVPARWAPPDLIALDVGQGDSLVVRIDRRQAVLIDGGGSPNADFDVGARIVVPALRALGVQKLPLVVATHADLDHIEGLVAVLHTFPVGVLMVGHPAPERPAYVALIAAAAARGVPVIEGRRGERYALGGLTIEVLHPEALPGADSNEDSVALLLRWGDAPSALLLGDIPASVEGRLAIPPTPILLAPHHGSASSTSEALLRAAQPQVAWISVGENRYGHPAPSVLARLQAHRVPVRTTRGEGALRSPLPPPPPGAAHDSVR